MKLDEIGAAPLAHLGTGEEDHPLARRGKPLRLQPALSFPDPFVRLRHLRHDVG